jgi:L-threonylcarbamoyladenylate synthase
VGWVTWQAEPDAADPNVLHAGLPADPAGYAAGLYATLHALDAAGVDRIVVASPPDGDEWLAVRDRLRRASS